MEAKILRQRAREHLSGNWGLSIGIAAVAALLGGLITGASFLPDLYVGTQDVIRSTGQSISTSGTSVRIGVLGFAAFLIGGVLQIGYAQILLNQHDGKPFQFADLFSQFDRFGTGFAQAFLRELYTMLWMLLLIVPGIIKALSYSMTPFILAEHPNLTASQAIDLSKQMMEGHKMELFILDLTFFGWIFLAVITGNLGFLALNPYLNAAYAAFYRQLQAENRYTSYESYE